LAAARTISTPPPEVCRNRDIDDSAQHRLPRCHRFAALAGEAENSQRLRIENLRKNMSLRRP